MGQAAETLMGGRTQSLVMVIQVEDRLFELMGKAVHLVVEVFDAASPSQSDPRLRHGSVNDLKRVTASQRIAVSAWNFECSVSRSSLASSACRQFLRNNAGDDAGHSQMELC